MRSPAREMEWSWGGLCTPQVLLTSLVVALALSGAAAMTVKAPPIASPPASPARLRVPAANDKVTLLSDEAHFFCPWGQFGFICEGADRSSDSSRPLLCFFPGLSASGLEPMFQFPDLGNKFEVKSYRYYRTDRSDFHGQREAASAALREWMRAHAGRDVYVMGDSYGGLVAAGVALTLQEEQQLKGVILSNPATSFPSTFFARWGATLCRLPGPLFSAFSGVLALLTLDKVVLRNMISVARGDRRWPEDRIAASDAPKLNVWLDAMMGNMEPLDSRTLLFRIQNLLGTG
eukprot:TRINITY_DN775_c0_g1_i6.p1 TRINITY_DN775_c0_g1~~TRINITY_DN775_c0_g1_i6.p1  ORF type:complete len:309 (-),score=51.93 TRINITY_DN775_c0_g1_i6:1483-2352(-)